MFGVLLSSAKNLGKPQLQCPGLQTIETSQQPMAPQAASRDGAVLGSGGAGPGQGTGDAELGWGMPRSPERDGAATASLDRHAGATGSCVGSPGRNHGCQSCRTKALGVNGHGLAGGQKKGGHGSQAAPQSQSCQSTVPAPSELLTPNTPGLVQSR